MATSASVGAHTSGNHYVQVGANSALGNYMLFCNDSGILLYDTANSVTVHRVNWDS